MKIINPAMVHFVRDDGGNGIGIGENGFLVITVSNVNTDINQKNTKDNECSDISFCLDEEKI